MNRTTSRALVLALTLGAVGLLALLLMLAAGPQPAARADTAPPVWGARGDTIKVPDDYPTIQAAIDAAAEGNTILVAGSDYDYKENLSISNPPSFNHRPNNCVTTISL